MDFRVSLYANRMLVEELASSGVLEDCVVAGCELNGMVFRGCRCKGVQLREVSAPALRLENTHVRDSAFFRCGLSRMSFTASVMCDTILDGLVLIRSSWRRGTLKNVRLRSSCLQRAEFSRMRVCSSSFTDFEALESRLEDCLFAGCLFRLTYGSGMNGFSGSRVKNCIFTGCRFEGFPLRGAILENCLVIRPAGQASDEALVNARRRAPLVRGEQALKLLARLA
jgi:uncharacterized protein YjbI with pentapeptide repeats